MTPNSSMQGIIAKIVKKGLNYGDALNAFRSKTRGIFTTEEIQEGKKLLQDSYKTPATRAVNIEDKYALENPYVNKLDENLMLGLLQIVLDLLRQHYNKTFHNALSSAAADVRPYVIRATSPNAVRFIPARRGRPTGYSVPTVTVTGNNKTQQMINLEKQMIQYGYDQLSPENKSYIIDHNISLFNDLMNTHRLPNVDTSKDIDMDALRTDVIYNAMHGRNSMMLEQYMDPEGASAYAKKMLGIGGGVGAAALADYYFDDPVTGHKAYSSSYKNGGKSKIHIKKKNEGKFTASAKAAGESVQEHAQHVLNDPNATPLQKKRANFARNAAKWHH